MDSLNTSKQGSVVVTGAAPAVDFHVDSDDFSVVRTKRKKREKDPKAQGRSKIENSEKESENERLKADGESKEGHFRKKKRRQNKEQEEADDDDNCEVMDDVEFTARKRKKHKSKKVKEVTQVEESNGVEVVEETVDVEDCVRKKKKHGHGALDETSSGVEELREDVYGAEYSGKKKKKKIKEKLMGGEGVCEESEVLANEDALESVKKKKKRKERYRREQEAEDEDLGRSRDAGLKKGAKEGKQKYQEVVSEEDSTGITLVGDFSHTEKKKKRKKTVQKADDVKADNVRADDNIDGESPRTKKKKKQRKEGAEVEVEEVNKAADLSVEDVDKEGKKRKHKKRREESFETTDDDRAVSASQDDVTYLFSQSESLLASLREQKKKKKRHSDRSDASASICLSDDVSPRKKRSDSFVLENTQGFTIANNSTGAALSGDSTVCDRGIQEETPQKTPESLCRRSRRVSDDSISDASVSQLGPSWSCAVGSDGSCSERLPGGKRKKASHDSNRLSGGTLGGTETFALADDARGGGHEEGSGGVTRSNEACGSSQGFVVSSTGFDVNDSPFKSPASKKAKKRALLQPELSFEEVSGEEFSSEHFVPSSRHKQTSEHARGEQFLGSGKRKKCERRKIRLDSGSEDVDFFADIVSPPEYVFSTPKQKKKRRDDEGTESVVEISDDDETPVPERTKNRRNSEHTCLEPLQMEETVDTDLIIDVLSQYFGPRPDDASDRRLKKRERKLREKYRKGTAEDKSSQRKKSPQAPHSANSDGSQTEVESRAENRENGKQTEHATEIESRPKASVGSATTSRRQSDGTQKKASPSSLSSPARGGLPKSPVGRNREKPAELPADDSNTRPSSEAESAEEEIFRSLSRSAEAESDNAARHDAETSAADDDPTQPSSYRSFMDYVTRGEFPIIHQTTLDPPSEEIKEYEKTAGLTLRTNRFSSDEDEVLQRNFKHIAEFFHLRRPFLILGHQGTESVEDFRNAKKLAAKHKILPLLGKDLPRRTLRMLYRRARALFHPMRMERNAPFTHEETKQLLVLHARLGPNWQEIEKLMDKPADTIRMHFIRQKDRQYGVRNGRWEPEEESRLQEAMKKFGHTDSNGRLPKDVTWDKVAQEVGTRGPYQCYKRWVYAFRNVEKAGSHLRVWNRFDTIHLIDKMYQMETMPSNDYDWNALTEHFPAIKRGTILHKKWRAMVAKHVPGYEYMDQKGQACHLYKYYLPSLLATDNVTVKEAVELSKRPRARV